jgi:Predicted metal-dependent membrane protease
MSLKAAYSNSSPFAQLLILIASVIAGSMIFSFIGVFIVTAQEINNLPQMGDTDAMAAFIKDLTANPAYMKQIQLLSQIGMFILPTFLCAWMFSPNYKKYLKIEYLPKPSMLGLTMLAIIFLFPFVNLTLYLNQQMVLPEWLSGLESWMRQSEDSNNGLIERMLAADNLGMLLINLLVMAILPGFGEEILFRGVGQNIMGRIFKNHHAVIWIVAVIFSAIHNQYYGFIPRMLLGATFGYLLFYTRNMWIPIIAHFTHNAFSVITYYIFQNSPEKAEQIDSIGMASTWWLGIASLALFLIIFFQIKKQSEDLVDSDSCRPKLDSES